jgi:DNA invertase Pin-like site-specific DNA recombinase
MKKHKGKYVSYLRVSTKEQGDSGLGLDAQRAAVRQWLKGGEWELAAEVVEVESGKCNNRPKLQEALRLCRLHNAALIVSKLDRLARDAEFLLRLVRESGERGVVFCDFPNVAEGSTGKLMITQMAAFAEFEATRISERTKAALKQAKLRGVRLGGGPGPAKESADKGRAQGLKLRQEKAAARAADLQPFIAHLRSEGVLGQRAIARALNEAGLTSPQGGLWSAPSVARLLELGGRGRGNPASSTTPEA